MLLNLRSLVVFSDELVLISGVVLGDSAVVGASVELKGLDVIVVSSVELMVVSSVAVSVVVEVELNVRYCEVTVLFKDDLDSGEDV